MRSTSSSSLYPAQQAYAQQASANNNNAPRPPPPTYSLPRVYGQPNVTAQPPAPQYYPVYPPPHPQMMMVPPQPGLYYPSPPHPQMMMAPPPMMMAPPYPYPPYPVVYPSLAQQPTQQAPTPQPTVEQITKKVESVKLEDKATNVLNFTLNGKPVTITDPDPTMNLNDFIRSQPGMKGTKVMCREAGCGACTVNICSSDLTTGQVQSYSANSCVRPICSIDGMSVTTIEGIGSQRSGFHPIQERIADNNGSQCGYCTPGMVMSMYSLLENNPNATQQEIEDGFDGNICRCTGYQPILSAMKSFASDAKEKQQCKGHTEGTCCSKHFFPDIEELCHPKVERCATKKKSHKVATQSKLLKSVKDGATWWSPTTLPDLYSLLQQYSGQTYKLVVGNTSVGVFKIPLYTNPSVWIDIHNISELKSASFTITGGANIGAAVTLADVITLLSTYDTGGQATSSYPTIVKHIKRIANHQVRNEASWAGNLMIVHDNDDFPSDLCTVLLGVGATLTIGSAGSVQVNVAISDFLTMDMSNKVILSVNIPVLAQGEVFQSFKVAYRHQNSHAYVNAALRATVTSGGVVTNPTFAYGGIFAKAGRMTKTEACITGQNPTVSTTLSSCLSVLQAEAVPTPGPKRIQYRNSLATSLFYKFFLCLLPSNMVAANIQTAMTPYERPLSDGILSFQSDPNEYPVSAPIPKLKSRLQASGEVIYAGDIPEPPNTLHGAFVRSTNALASIGTKDMTNMMAATGVQGYIGAEDIQGLNDCGPVIHDEEILASSNVYYYGQAIGVVLADTQAHAYAAAKLANITYTNQQTPILSIDDAIAAGAIWPPIPQEPITPVVSGDVNSGFASSSHIISGTVETGAQTHFHMETFTALCIPQDDGQLVIYATTQGSTQLQAAVALATGLPLSKIQIMVKQMGGGYGGKISKPNQMVCCAAVAAIKYNQPIKIVFDINTNFEMTGRRHPHQCQYKVGFDDNGMLKAVQYVIYIDGGFSVDFGPASLGTVFQTIDNNYYCENWSITGHCVRTNLPSNTSMRGPGWINAVFFMEYVMEHVAKTLNADVSSIKQMNFYKEGQVTPYGQTLVYYNIPTMWETMKLSSDYQNRLNAVNSYNSANKWTKKGISLVNVKFGIGWQGANFGVLLNVYADGTVNLTHSGTEIGQGIDTKVAQVVAYELGIGLDQISVWQTSTVLQPNTNVTGGSITSGLNSLAAINACQLLQAKLQPVRAQLPSTATWTQVVSTAIGQNIDLQTKGWVNPPASPYGPWLYNSYVVACSEVLLDVLTGEIQNLRTDILFDCGKSLNPAIDIGQVQGAFMQGVGLHTCEEVVINDDGSLLTNGTWEYKPPSSQDIPIDFRVTLLKNAPNPVGVLSSKASGEPPLAAGCSVSVAARHAIDAARMDQGNTDFYQMNAPATVESIQTNCLVSCSNLSF